jgi:hypothetical protein
MLSLAKHCCTDPFLFSITSLRFVIPPFALMQKVEPKNQGKPEPLRASCRPRTTTVITAFTIHVLRSKKLVSLLLTTFSKWHAFPSSVTNDRRCIPLSFSLKYNPLLNLCGIRRCTILFDTFFSTVFSASISQLHSTP